MDSSGGRLNASKQQGLSPRRLQWKGICATTTTVALSRVESTRMHDHGEAGSETNANTQAYVPGTVGLGPQNRKGNGEPRARGVLASRRSRTGTELEQRC